MEGGEVEVCVCERDGEWKCTKLNWHFSKGNMPVFV